VIYVAGIPHSVSAPVKIGVSANVASRLIQLRRGESMPLRVASMIPDPGLVDMLATFDVDDGTERRLHSIFKDRRIEGEWFYLGGPVAAVDRVTRAIETGDLALRAGMTHLSQAATRHHEMYRAWVQAGFTEGQAIQLLTEALKSDPWWK
jgi:Meiotically up-regulated gene 113